MKKLDDDDPNICLRTSAVRTAYTREMKVKYV